MIRKCLFPAAGFGTRFLPVTKTMPKELLPIIDKPLLQYGVEEAFEASMTEMVMVINSEKLAIQHYFTHNHDKYTEKQQLALSELDMLMQRCQFHFPHQQEMRGLGHAIFCGKEIINNEPFAVILPDDFCASNTLKQMVKLYHQYQCCVVATEIVPETEVNRYGIIKTQKKPLIENVYRVTDMLEKPKIEETPSRSAIIGRYILTPDIFDIIEKLPPRINGEVQITDALKIKAQRGEVISYQLPKQRYDCGTAKGYVQAINSYSKKHETP